MNLAPGKDIAANAYATIYVLGRCQLVFSLRKWSGRLIVLLLGLWLALRIKSLRV